MPGNEEFVIINNIPKEYHTSHLRHFFSDFIEAGKFTCFHFRHRPEVQKPTESQNKQDLSRKVTNCCVVKLNSSFVEDFIKNYNGEHWFDSKGETMSPCCFIRKIITSESPRICAPKATSFKKGTVSMNLPLDQENFSSEDIDSLIEMHPPSFMPNGNVGTKTSHFLHEIKACRLPPSLITKLGLKFPRKHHKKIYGSVPFDYKSRYQSNTTFVRRPEKVNKKSPWCSRLPQPSVVKDREESSEESEEEEWDRVESLQEDVSNQERNKERLFEEKIELKWEKGGSGLVFYTDAQIWDQKEGDFDAKTADDWDIDMRVYEGSGQDVDKDMKDFISMRREKKLRNGTETEIDRRYDFAAFERYSKGFGRKILESQGWKQGKGVGRNAAGIAEPLPNDGQLPFDKKGFGYRGEKLNRYPQKESSRKRRNSDCDNEIFISTIYDNPLDSDPPNSSFISSSFARLKYRKEFIREHENKE